MKSSQLALHSCTTAIALSMSLAGCGGGGAASTVDVSSASTSRMHVLSIGGGGGTPPPCTVSPPVVSNIDFGEAGWAGDDSPGAPLPVATVVSTALSFTDSPSDIHTIQWDWGDSSVDATGVVMEANGAGRANASHVYMTPGVYNVSVVVSDACASTRVTRQLVVYDPSGGFVTGGGWVTSPVGAYTADPSLTGRANFGFVSKYLKGATVPSGETEFQFQTAGLNFHSEAYEWLVIAGARAQYKGSGSINGKNGYGFMLTAVDGQWSDVGKGADRFRIKIWHTDAGNKDLVDYDNQTDLALAGGASEGTALGGGSIVIHK